jgi:hypothetical protein
MSISEQLKPFPPQISGCQLWLDPSDDSTIQMSGSSVVSIREKINNIRFTTQGNSSFLTKGNFINGRQSLYINNSSAENCTLLAPIQQPSNGCLFIVWQNYK